MSAGRERHCEPGVERPWNRLDPAHRLCAGALERLNCQLSAYRKRLGVMGRTNEIGACVSACDAETADGSLGPLCEQRAVAAAFEPVLALLRANPVRGATLRPVRGRARSTPVGVVPVLHDAGEGPALLFRLPPWLPR